MGDQPQGDVERALEARIVELLEQRGPGRTICPSDAARSVFDDLADTDRPASWRALMEPVRRAAARLVSRGELVVTQRGNIVDLATAKGPIRLRRTD